MVIRTLKEIWGRTWLGFLLLLNTVLRSWNLFGYPIYNEDEGTYVSQAMAILEHGELAYYTYWYDHAPFGWMTIAAWQKAVGWLPGAQDLLSVDLGRTLMVVASGVVLWLVVSILWEAGVRLWVIQITGLWLIISPLSNDFQRSIYLDNLMIMWVLLAVYILMTSQTGLRLMLAAAVFGLAILTKETAIFFFPFILILLKQKVARSNWRFVITLWL